MSQGKILTFFWLFAIVILLGITIFAGCVEVIREGTNDRLFKEKV